ncbi:class I adenylate-forming enzyme family protein [Nonomuraea aurantiaca]|uniref:class I adenylate-forming enzyme family protein n=1 Tax=Nonomuraea aurantiaca TaxID=2878562 RepID=UPI001CD9ADBC|nr:class I adenylate-forming enzyme family protein [Nonomuraea aurantiaca]MCA2224485.1 acyl--CoA ligase [Nonomuraea aurantiaca]
MRSDLLAQVFAACERTPRATAIVGARGRELTFGGLRERALRIRDRLVAEGLERGDGVLYAVEPSPDAIAVALGVVAAGGVLVLADPGLAPEVLRARLRLARPRWVVAGSLLYAVTSFAPLRALARRRGVLLPGLRDPLPELELRHAYTGRWLPGVPRAAVRLRGLGGPMPTTDASRGEVDDPAAVIFTSGTTAHPRAVVHTRASLAAGLEIFRDRFPVEPGDVVHTDGLMLGLPALIGGATWSMPGPAKLIFERRVTHLYCVPVELAGLVDRVERLPDSLRHLLLGSAPAPPAVLRKAIAAAPGAEVLSVYAMTEALPIALAGAAEKLACAEGDLLGAPLPGVGVRFTEDQELVVSGPHVARGYLGEPPHDEVATGDLVRLDGQGRLVLLGRKKDMILRDGFNIYPSLYEPAIAALPGVADAAIVGLADPVTGDEEVVLALVPGDGFQEAAVRARLPALVDAGALPDRIAVLPDFPRSSRRKLDRAALRAAIGRP